MRKLNKYIFPNGLSLASEFIAESNICSVGVFFKGGSMSDGEDDGISHFVEHLLYTSVQKAFIKIGQDCSSANAYTTKDYLSLNFIASTDNFYNIFRSFIEAIFMYKIDETDYIAQQKIIKQEVKYSSGTQNQLINKIISYYYDSKVLTHPICGSDNSVSAITIEKIKLYLNELFTPSRIIISIAGHVNCEKCIELIGEYLSPYDLLGIDKTNGFEYPTINELQIPEKSCINLAAEGKKQITYIRAWKTNGTKNKKELDSFQFIYAILGGGMGSDLYNMFQKNSGLSYMVYSKQIVYYFGGIYMQSALINASDTEKAASCFDKVIKNRLENGFNHSELLSVKNRLKLQQYLISESVFSEMEKNAKQLLWNDNLQSLDESLAEIDKTSCDDINNLFYKYFKNEKHIDILV